MTFKTKTTLLLLVVSAMWPLCLGGMELTEFRNKKERDQLNTTVKNAEQHRIEANKKERSGDGGSMKVVESDGSSSSESMQSKDAAGGLFREKAPAVGANAWDEQLQQESRAPLSLASSRVALEQEPEASRFVVREAEDGTLLLVAEEANPAINPQTIRMENLNATRDFRAALQTEVPGVDIEDLFQVDPMKTLKNYPSLSSIKIRVALERVDRLVGGRKISDASRKEMVTQSSEHDDIKVPCQSKRELEDLGWHRFYEIAASRSPSVLASTLVLVSDKDAAASPSKAVEQSNPYLGLFDWSHEQVSNPRIEEQRRWMVRREFHRLRKETRCFFSAPTIAVEKTGKSSESCSTDAISIKRPSNEAKGLLTELQQKIRSEKEKWQAWMALVKKAEARRRAEHGTSLGKAEEMIQAWARADDLALQEQDEREMPHDGPLQEAKHAAQHYYLSHSASGAGDLTLWNTLTTEEQKHYNDHINRENQLHAQEIASEEHFLEKIQQQLQQEEARSQQFLKRIAGMLTGTQEATLQLIGETRRYYQDRLQQLQERREKIRYAKLTHPERASIASKELGKEIEKKLEWLRQEMARVVRLNTHSRGTMLLGLSSNDSIEGARYLYERALLYHPLGKHRRLVQLYLRAAEAREKQVAALEVNNQRRATIHKEIARALGSNKKENPGAVYYYYQAAIEREKGRYRKAEEYRCRAHAEEKKAASRSAELEEEEGQGELAEAK